MIEPLRTLLAMVPSSVALGLSAGGALFALALVTYAVRRRIRVLRALDAQRNLLVELRSRLDVLAARQQQTLIDESRLREQIGARAAATHSAVTAGIAEQRAALAEAFGGLREQIGATLAEHRAGFEQRQGDGAHRLAEQLQQGFLAVQQQVTTALAHGAAELGQRVETLAHVTERRLQDIAGQVDRRLADGFEKTTATFADILRRLALIDEAQKRITALSGEVVSLQQILADKRSRGAFGEVQLAGLVRNVMPEAHFALQYALPNGRIADCALFLPPPTGTLAVDAKFPLETWRRLSDPALSDFERRQAERQFKLDIRKHIRDIATKYIVPNVTADGAIMFIPAEAVFAEIQGRHPDLVAEAHTARVWLVSPTTLWAILTTACSVLKDAATREQVDIIRDHLGRLAQDFERFRTRLDGLARHIAQAHDDVQKVHVSARRIADRFGRIERVELETRPAATTEPRGGSGLEAEE